VSAEAGDASDLLGAALDYAECGLPVFPCINRPNSKVHKHPHTDHGFQDATTDPATIKKWWDKWPNALIGMPTGKPSGIAVLDLDVKNGKDGLAAVPDWQQRSPVVVTTGSGGKHVYFRDDGVIRNAQDLNDMPGVDVRGTGGYVIIPPSPGYRWDNGRDFGTLPPWPDDLRPANREAQPDREPAEDTADAPVIAAALRAISADCGYEVWFKVGCALYSALGEAGFIYFDEWSRTCPEKYDAQDCAKQWEACGTTTEINIGTLYHLANEANPNWRAGIKWPQLILSSADFIAAFAPPDYLVDGLMQRRYLYSLTAPTGTGKTAIVMRVAAHVALGLPLAGRGVERGKVLMLAGENPDDVRTRWIKLCEDMKVKTNAVEVFFIAGVVRLSDKELRKRIGGEAKTHGPFALVIVDTSAAFFEGKEENNNIEALAHARILRSLIDLIDGGPTILTTAHPIKSPNNDNLLPRGGGAFLNEVDGNLVCQKQDGGVVDLHWHGKIRGSDFAPIPFKVETAYSERLKDSKGRRISTVVARPITREERAQAEDIGRLRQTQLLAAMARHPGATLDELATAAVWHYQNGDPNKTLAYRTMQELEAQRLVTKAGGRWTLTKAGRQQADAL